MIALLLLLSVLFHTTTQLDEWFEDWSTRVGDDYLNGQILTEFRNMLDRHPQLVHGYTRPQPAYKPITARGMGSDVQQWVPLLLKYFPESSLDLALCVMTAESGGNPNAANPYSTAAGLFQFLRSTWDNIVPRSVTGGSYDSGQVYQPEANIRAAAWLVANDGWHHWNPYKDGRCR